MFSITDAIVRTIFLRIFSYSISDVDGKIISVFGDIAWSTVHPFSPYTPREVSRVLGGETETRSPSPQGCFPACCDTVIPLNALALRAPHRPGRKKRGWTPMSDTDVRDFKRYSHVIRPINAGQPSEMRTMLRGRPNGRHEAIHRGRGRVIQVLMSTLILIKIVRRGDAVTGLARCYINV